MSTEHLGSDQVKLETCVKEILEPVGLFLDELIVRSAGRRRLVQVMVDSVNRLDLDQLANLSRQIDAAIEADQILGDISYTLEVSSRGVDRPLVLARHFQANIGRLIEFKTRDGQKRKLRLKSVSDSLLTFEDGKTFEIADVAPAQVVLEFNRKDEPEISFEVTEELADED